MKRSMSVSFPVVSRLLPVVFLLGYYFGRALIEPLATAVGPRF